MKRASDWGPADYYAVGLTVFGIFFVILRCV